MDKFFIKIILSIILFFSLLTGSVILITNIFDGKNESLEFISKNSSKEKEDLSYHLVLDLSLKPDPRYNFEPYPYNTETTHLEFYCNLPKSEEQEIKNAQPYARNLCIQELDKRLLSKPKSEYCTDIYGGPYTAVIYGEINKKEYYESFSLTNGCEIARWKSVIEFILTNYPS